MRCSGCQLEFRDGEQTVKLIDGAFDESQNDSIVEFENVYHIGCFADECVDVVSQMRSD